MDSAAPAATPPPHPATASAQPDRRKAGGSVLDLDNLWVHYGKYAALRGVTASFAGGALGLLGPNGAGKSSMLRAILGLVRASKGTVAVLGEDVRRAGAKLRKRFGYMPERDSYISDISGVSGLSHLAQVCGLKPEDAMLRAHDVLHFVGLGEERYREVSSYSVGMRQRYKLASALVHDPDILFLDEPTNGLDPDGRIEMLNLVERVCRKHGIHLIMASHLLPDVERLCDHVWVLDQGLLKKDDSIANLTAAARGAKRVRLQAGGSAAFKEAAEKAGLVVERGGHETELNLAHPARELETAEVFALAATAGTRVLSIKPAARSLEDAFLEALEAGD